MKRAQTFYIPVAANDSDQVFALAFKNASQGFAITRVGSNNSTPNVQLALYVDGNFVSSWDCSQFAAGVPHVPVEVQVSPQITVEAHVQDNTGAGDADFAIVIYYELGPARA